MSKYEYRFDPELPNNTAAAIYQAARRGGRNVLDIGSGPGIIGSFLAKNDGKDVTCVDNDVEALESAAREGVDHTLVADLREPDWFRELSGRHFDVVVLADVLEHVVDPERILRDLRRERLVADDGRLVVSVPNACHESVIVELATGHFTYTDTGLLDRTHLRFFTLDSVTDLLESCGFRITETHRTTMRFEQTRQSVRAPEVGEHLRAAIEQLGPQARTFQYVLTARPTTDEGIIAQLREDLQAALDQVAGRESDLAAVRQELESCRAQVGELQALRAEVDRLTGRLQALYASKTWRAGRAVRRVLGPALAVPRLLRRRG